MAIQTRTKQVFEQDTGFHERYLASTIGTVVDTSDPQQMGRVRVVCPSWGESYDTNIADLPWCIYSTPFGGTTETGTRGADLSQSSGPISYGMWAIPKVGAQVIVMCLDGNPQHRVWVGCLHSQLGAHTMPHGRWMYEDHPALDKAGAQVPYGPFTTTEHPIEPLSSNLQRAFGTAEQNYEWRTRAADYSVSAVDIEHLNVTYSKAADDKDVNVDGWTSRQGYQSSRTAPFLPGAATSRNFDSLVYSITSPGFHSLSMDDRQENCRVRLRTMSGHQIILDDTNERVYIATAEGRNWIEMDQAGNITAFTEGNYSVRANKDINFTSDQTIRMHAAGIHLRSTSDVCIESATDTNVKVGGSLRIGVSGDTLLSSGGSFDVSASSASVGSDLDVTGKLTASSADFVGLMNAGAAAGSGFYVRLTDSPSPSISSPSSPSSPNEQPAKWTSMVPTHEPYARVMTANDYTHAPELAYTDPNVGKIERGRTIFRGRFWRR